MQRTDGRFLIAKGEPLWVVGMLLAMPRFWISLSCFGPEFCSLRACEFVNDTRHKHTLPVI